MLEHEHDRIARQAARNAERFHRAATSLREALELCRQAGVPSEREAVLTAAARECDEAARENRELADAWSEDTSPGTPLAAFGLDE